MFQTTSQWMIGGYLRTSPFRNFDPNLHRISPLAPPESAVAQVWFHLFFGDVEISSISFTKIYGGQNWLPPGTGLHSDGKSSFLTGQSTISTGPFSMAM